MQEIGRFQTKNASKFLQQLCKHFAHKIEVKYDTKQGEVVFSAGRAEFIASDTELRAVVFATNEDAIMTVKGVVDSHLARFAFREEFEAMEWQKG